MEEDSFPSVCELLHTKDFQAAINTLSSWSRISLAEFCTKFPGHYEIMKSNDFAEFWQQRRSEINQYSFKAQGGVCDADLTIGHTLYLLALRDKKHKSEGYQTHLNQALKFFSIHAAQALIHEIVITREPINLAWVQSISGVFFNLEGLAKRHGTPGYLLLANGYLHLFDCLSKMDKKENPDEWQIQYDGTLFSLWKSLYLARHAEDISTDAIHNAYFGRGLANSNPFQLTTLDAMIERCGELSNNPSLRSRGQRAAALAFKQFSSSSLWASAVLKPEQACQQGALAPPKN